MTLVANEAPASYWSTCRARSARSFSSPTHGLRELQLPGCFAARDDSRASSLPALIWPRPPSSSGVLCR